MCKNYVLYAVLTFTLPKMRRRIQEILQHRMTMFTRRHGESAKQMWPSS